MGVALNALRDVAKVRAGETVLVTGAGGGLGVHTVRIASALGAKILALTTSPHKVAPLEELGADVVVLVEEPDFSDVVLAITEDTVGSAVFRPSLLSLAQFGRLVLMGEVTDGKVSMRLPELMFRDTTIVGTTGAGLRHITDAAELVRSGRVSPVVLQSFALENAKDAYRLMRKRKVFGRVVLVP